MHLTRSSHSVRYRRAAEIDLETRRTQRPLLPAAELFAWRP